MQRTHSHELARNYFPDTQGKGPLGGRHSIHKVTNTEESSVLGGTAKRLLYLECGEKVEERQDLRERRREAPVRWYLSEILSVCT